MCTGIALPLEDLPTAVLDRHRLRERVYDRAGVPELRFLWLHEPTLLPSGNLLLLEIRQTIHVPAIAGLELVLAQCATGGISVMATVIGLNRQSQLL